MTLRGENIFLEMSLESSSNIHSYILLLFDILPVVKKNMVWYV